MLEKIFIPIRKVDAEQRLVYGVLAAETPDLMNEILAYDASKAAFETWAGNAEKVSGGKSMGNLRVMHNPKVAGKFTQVECNDELKQIEVVAKVEADDEWKLVETGCYTGFSIGAKAAWKKKDGDLTRYAVKTMVEGSLVDLPCIPTATFDYIKGATTELRKFIVSDTPSAEPTYVLPVTDFKNTFRQIMPQLEKVGVGDRTLASFKSLAQSAGIKKSMWDVSDFAVALCTLNCIRMNLKSEAEWEGDNSPIPEKLRTWIDEGASLMKELLDEESSELTQDTPLDMGLEMAAKAETKKAAVAEVQKMADEVKTEVAADAVVEKAETKVETPAVDIVKSIDDAIAKRTQVFDEAVTKLNGELDEQKTALKSLLDSVKSIAETLKTIPAPAKGVISVSKMQESGADDTEEVTDVRSAMRKALSPENAKSVMPTRSYGQVTK